MGNKQSDTEADDSPPKLVQSELAQSRASDRKAARKAAHFTKNLLVEEFHRQIEDCYEIKGGKRLGQGGFGTVCEVVHKKSGKLFAMKTVELSRIQTEAQFKFVLNEVDVIRQLDHPNIVRVQEVFHTPDNLFLVMDRYTGGDLLASYQFESEAATAGLVAKIVSAIRYCHDHHVAHRDLKLDNVMYASLDPDAEPKLIDFGLGTSFEDGMRHHDLVGTYLYMDPAVIRGTHSPTAADMWSIGVIAFCLLSGYPPFNGRNIPELKAAIQHLPLEFNDPVWDSISEEAKDFISQLLVKDYHYRPTAAQAMEHPWLKAGKQHAVTALNVDHPLRNEVIKNMKRFRHSSAIKKIALSVVARTMDVDEMNNLQKEFQKADLAENKGVISLAAFEKVLRESPAFKNEDVTEIFKGMDLEQRGEINFTEFIAAAMSRHELGEGRLRYAFERMDYDNDGAIDVNDLQMLVGMDMSDNEIKDAIKTFDKSGTGRVTFGEFFSGMMLAGQSVDAMSSSFMTSTALRQEDEHRKTVQQYLETLEEATDEEAAAEDSSKHGKRVGSLTKLELMRVLEARKRFESRVARHLHDASDSVKKGFSVMEHGVMKVTGGIDKVGTMTGEGIIKAGQTLQEGIEAGLGIKHDKSATPGNQR